MKVLLVHLDWDWALKGPHSDTAEKAFLGLCIVSNVSNKIKPFVTNLRTKCTYFPTKAYYSTGYIKAFTPKSFFSCQLIHANHCSLVFFCERHKWMTPNLQFLRNNIEKAPQNTLILFPQNYSVLYFDVVLKT